MYILGFSVTSGKILRRNQKIKVHRKKSKALRYYANNDK